MTNIWKDPKVELPEMDKNIIFIINDYVHTGDFNNEPHYKPFFADGFRDGDTYRIIEVDKWCYEEDLIKQAQN